MNKLNMRQFGTVLTGREHGKKVMQEISKQLHYPVVLDFEGVGSLGSSFGDEVVAEIAKRQHGNIGVINGNVTVWACLNNLIEDHKIKIFDASK